MDIHEYQAKNILKGYGIPIPAFEVARSVGDVKKIMERLQLKEAVLKIQIHAGGRGKAGGVKMAKSLAEAEALSAQLIGMQVINNQTGPRGAVAHEILVTAPVDIAQEFYLGAAIDRQSAQPILIASPEGGVDIEESRAILRLPIGLDGRVRHFHLVRLAAFMGWKGEAALQGIEIAKQVARAFMDVDGSMLEINPLVMAKDGKMWAIDAKLGVDDNALFRQDVISSYYDSTQYLPSEVDAKAFDLSYIALDGNIGCMVNGAGLAMATMDIIQYHGGKPANFLDVGGGASTEKVAAGFKIILDDPKVQVILVNIFGGIMNCGTLAEGILQAAKEYAIKIPLVVRMEGTNVEEGRRLLQSSGLHIISAKTLTEAAEKAVAALR